MSNVPAIRAAVNQANNKAEEAAGMLQQTDDKIKEALQVFTNATQTSGRAEVETTIKLLGQASKNVADAIKALGAARQSADQFSAAL